MKVVIYKGRNGRKVAVDLDKVEAVFDEGSDGSDLFTSSDHYRVAEPFDNVINDWKR